MLKEQIKQLFDNYQNNKITDVPMLTFRPIRNPFQYLPPEKILFKDLRTLMLPKQTTIDKKTESISDKIKRYANEFQFRKSYQKRIMTHTLQYTALSFFIVFGLYSRQFSGFQRCKYVLKQTLKTALYSGGIFTMNELLCPFNYKIFHQLQQKHMFTTSNVLSTVLFWPVIFFMQKMNFLVSVRKALFICAFGQIRDFQTQNQRFYKLNPDHLSTKGKIQAERIKHPCQDPSKRLITNLNTRAQQERRQQEKDELQRQALTKNKGQKIPSANMALILPEIYRHPTPQESLQHEIKAAKKTQQLLKERGIEWFTVQVPDQNLIQNRKKQRNEKKEKKSWFPF